MSRMSWSFLIFSSKSPKEVQKIADILEVKLEALEDDYPTVREDHGCPSFSDAEKAKPSDYLDDLKKRADLPDGNDLKISNEIITRMTAAKSMLEVDSFSFESSPLGVTILRYLLTQTAPNIINSLDGWDKGEDFLGILSECQGMGLDGKEESDEDDKPAEKEEAVEEDDPNTPLHQLQTQIFSLMERARRDMNARMEAEKAFKNMNSLAQKLLNHLASARNIEEQMVIKSLKLEKEQFQKAFDELKEIFSKIKKSL